jgi:aminoglycoside phosphotransferase (APT) family kinase protein
VPEIVGVGDPGFGYPEKWSVVRFLEGLRPVVPGEGETRRALAQDLADVLRALGDLAVPPPRPWPTRRCAGTAAGR